MRTWIAVVALFLAACTRASLQDAQAPSAFTDSMPQLTLLAPDLRPTLLSVELATTPEQQATGLMERTELAPGTGMLFVFPDEQQRMFWMKHTRIPLDILFFDAEGQFVSRARMEPCTHDPCATTPSGAPAQYALEVNAAEQLTAEVGPGWRMDLQFEM